ncbi:MAG TPA: phosphoribosylamine--glycine ligase [Virgibacillus sp.]|nr:phosphoribosylamine--glycine ligase [Virgibacillus sp.]
MKILVVGRGGREHSMITHIANNKQVTDLYAAPGNGGMNEHATCVNIDEMDIKGLCEFAKEKEIDLTIVGPENPLNAGIANRFQEEGLPIFAPTKEAALLEGSKQFAKEFMKKYDIPTADYAIFTTVDEAKKYVEEKGAPIVVKADGLAEGKGVIVAETKQQAFDAIDDMLVDKAFDEAGLTIVIEEFLAGKEFSLMAFVHGNQVYPMMPARDHKRAYDHDAGPNTGGMGAFAPVPDVTEEILDFTNREVLQKTADSMIEEGRSFTGILYAGLMMTAQGPKVIEFNTRFGDPETQVVLPLLENDFIQVIQDVMNNEDPQLQWKDQACVGVVVASAGYPGTYEKNVLLPLAEPAGNTFVVQAGTKQSDQGLVSNGGRVLLVGGIGEDLASAAELSYAYLTNFMSDDAYFYRKDIGRELPN